MVAISPTDFIISIITAICYSFERCPLVVSHLGFYSCFNHLFEDCAVADLSSLPRDLGKDGGFKTNLPQHFNVRVRFGPEKDFVERLPWTYFVWFTPKGGKFFLHLKEIVEVLYFHCSLSVCLSGSTCEQNSKQMNQFGCGFR